MADTLRLVLNMKPEVRLGLDMLVACLHVRTMTAAIVIDCQGCRP